LYCEKKKKQKKEKIRTSIIARTDILPAWGHPSSGVTISVAVVVFKEMASSLGMLCE
jgi:hypothetical protein